ncbi:Putative alanine/glycine transport protein [Raoultella ornithinolytica]|nr:Putative alanine/glycine transport protein [Raoultella ornithinolytica]
MTYAFDLPAIVTGCALALVILLVIVRGLRGVAKLLQWIVPLMALLWVTTSLLIGLWHITALPAIFESIFPQRVRLAGSRRRRSGLYHQPGADQWFSARYVLERSGDGVNA